LQKAGLKDYVERLTISIERTSPNSGALKLAWERTALTIPFTLKTK
jgi:hypothetical protein